MRLPLVSSFVFLVLVAACSKENEVDATTSGKATNATCADLCDAIGRGDFGDCDGKLEDYGNDRPACIAECSDHLAKGDSSQQGLNCAIDLSHERGGDRCKRLGAKECGDFF